MRLSWIFCSRLLVNVLKLNRNTPHSTGCILNSRLNLSTFTPNTLPMSKYRALCLWGHPRTLIDSPVYWLYPEQFPNHISGAAPWMLSLKLLKVIVGRLLSFALACSRRLFNEFREYEYLVCCVILPRWVTKCYKNGNNLLPNDKTAAYIKGIKKPV